MATAKRRPQRPPAATAVSGGPRRLGNQQPPSRRPSSGAQRRYQRAQKGRTNLIAWGSVLGVVILVLVLVLVRVTSSPNSSSSSSSGIATGRDPALASAEYVKAVTTIPASVFDSVGTNGETVKSLGNLTVTKGQTLLTSGGKPRFVYVGAEFCPYCAVERYAMIAALSRFGTFSHLHETSSGSSDGNIPTFSFYHASYKSPYLVFTPYEEEDRQEPSPQPLVTPPRSVLSLYAKYDGNASGQPSTPFNKTGGSGIPFLDVANRFTSVGATSALYAVANSGNLDNGGPGRLQLANALRSPGSSLGKYVNAKAFIADANYLTAEVCAVDGGRPSAVCSSAGVQAAAKQLAAATPVG